MSHQIKILASLRERGAIKVDRDNSSQLWFEASATEIAPVLLLLGLPKKDKTFLLTIQEWDGEQQPGSSQQLLPRKINKRGGGQPKV